MAIGLARLVVGTGFLSCCNIVAWIKLGIVISDGQDHLQSRMHFHELLILAKRNVGQRRG